MRRCCCCCCCCLLFVVCCLWFVVCGLWFVVCCLLFVDFVRCVWPDTCRAAGLNLNQYVEELVTHICEAPLRCVMMHTH